MKVTQPGVTAFTELSDVPNSYLGEAEKHLAVNALATAIEFVPGSGGGEWGTITGTLSAQTDLQTALDNKLDDTQFSGLLKITVGAVAPVAPATGDLWVDTN